jgi:hypothetical protein
VCRRRKPPEGALRFCVGVLFRYGGSLDRRRSEVVALIDPLAPAGDPIAGHTAFLERAADTRLPSALLAHVAVLAEANLAAYESWMFKAGFAVEWMEWLVGHGYEPTFPEARLAASARERVEREADEARERAGLSAVDGEDDDESWDHAEPDVGEGTDSQPEAA